MEGSSGTLLLSAAMKRLTRIFFALVLLGAVFLGWHFRDPIAGFLHRYLSPESTSADRIKPDPIRYQELIGDLARERTGLATRYAEARTAQEISQIVGESRDLLNARLPELMRCWLGTGWSFNGTSTTPGSGRIACGYFVSTVLRDAGFQVERFKLAQQASQNIIATFLPRGKMHVRTGLSYQKFLDEVTSRGPGIRIVGLDNHVAFIVVRNDHSIRFIHSSGDPPYCVVDEDRENATALQNSNYRVTGDFTGSDEVIHGWLRGSKWPTKT